MRFESSSSALKSGVVGFFVAVTAGPLATPRVVEAQRLSPIGNYHAHLVSPATAKMLRQPSIPEVELPADLAQLLRDYERAIGTSDGAALAALFTEDGLLATPGGWARGRTAIRNVGSNTLATIRIRAQSFKLGDSVGSIVGTVADPNQSPPTDVASVVYTLRRDQTGRWLIAARMSERYPSPTPTNGGTFTADQLIAQHDSAGIQRALVLSAAYWFGSTLMPGADPTLPVADEYARVRAENDWIVAQTGRYPRRLIPFCSLHPLKPYALEEIERCAQVPAVKGIKLHLANSGVRLRKPDDVEQLRKVFRAVNQHRLAIVVHLRTDNQTYGRGDAEIFLREVLPEAPGIPIQIAHLVGWGGYDDSTDAAAGVFAEAIAKRDPRVANLWFDLTTIVGAGQPEGTGQRIADRVRQLGLRRAVFGSDLSDPAREWAELRKRVPLSPAEFAIVARNVSPPLR